ncbi:unnamed protein product [Brassica napus]|uniref:(rape) hypothetical protein n=1 Tax=Brassica napus TaxID=3708 RepID=A0A816JGW5_BRANA|nr:unnamed protein product [Brassica napus]
MAGSSSSESGYEITEKVLCKELAHEKECRFSLC